MGVASRVADYAQIPALHEGRGMVAGPRFNVPARRRFPAAATKFSWRFRTQERDRLRELVAAPWRLPSVEVATTPCGNRRSDTRDFLFIMAARGGLTAETLRPSVRWQND
jgi:hypothetical protein